MSAKKELKDLDTKVSGTTYTPNHEGEVDATSAAPKRLLGRHTTAATVHLALCLVMFSQVAMIVGAGAYARDIAAAVGGSDKITWISQAIAIITSVLGPPVSQAADYWGRKWFLVISTTSGFVGCLIISRATSMGMAIAGSVFCGFAYGSQPLLVAVASEILPRRYRTVAQSGLNMANGLGAVFGILREKLSKLDWIAYALLMSGIILFSMALTWSENPYPWKDSHVSPLFAVSCVLLIGLGYHQTMVRKDGMVHHGLFSLSICFFAAVVASFGVAAYTSVTKDIRGPLALSFLLYIIFGILMATSKVSSNIAVPWGYPIILGTGFALTFTCVITAAQMSAPPELIGLTISLRSFGGCVAIAIYAAIFNSAIKKYLVPDIASAVVPLGLSPKDMPQLIKGLTTHDEDLLAAIPGISQQILEVALHALKGAYLKSFRSVWIALAVMAFGAFVPSCFAINHKREFSSQIDASLEGEKNEGTVVHVE
ncbi:major facilitator superfamily domain-containing protein [Fusarium solani]|uniref:Major facilitator superfamily domain-containing protein n=1 Tax=Fusarium solani TaxID=169388 RepID=A0A9P9K8P2_FUSSL|nr:major facilitator superfamily domain-containing protein [Fusarium solani]KAH7248145.1 major facilitator superfamily domain-containing protein [Fusarium solani]